MSMAGCLAYQQSPLQPNVARSNSFQLNRKHTSRAMPSSTRLWFKDNGPDDDDGTSTTMTKEQLRLDWRKRSVDYYSKVMREQRRRDLGQAQSLDENPEYRQSFTVMANKHYVALRKIKDGKPGHAAVIYRRIIDKKLLNECVLPEPAVVASTASNNDNPLEAAHCDYAKLATTTLLLALVLQRTNADIRQVRSVFLKFFRVIALTEAQGKQCACSAKVMGAWALFELKQNNTQKSLQLAQLAYDMDKTNMRPLLHWKQFRDASALRRQSFGGTQHAKREM